MKVELVDKSSTFAGMGKQWDELLSRSVQRNIFLSHAWLFSWWSIYGNADQLYIIAVSDDSGALMGLFPGYISQPRIFAGVAVYPKTLRLLGSHSVGSDFLDCLADKDVATEVLSQLCDFLVQNSGDWDMAELNDMDAGSSFFLAFKQGLGVGNIRVGEQVQACPFIQLPNDWASFTDNLSRKKRTKLGYYRRLLDRNGVVALDTIAESDRLDKAIDEAMAMRSSRLKFKGIKFRPVTCEYLAFHKMVCQKLLRQQLLQLTFLTVDGERVAFAYQFRYLDRHFFYQTGFDMEWASRKVGYVLLSYEIENAVCSGFRYFEFLRGDEPYKYEWIPAAERHIRSLTLYTGSGSGITKYLLDKSYCYAKKQLKTIIGRNG
jgi:CelD/BcsL family acetyltransferase involved in cellulose biosynthesis